MCFSQYRALGAQSIVIVALTPESKPIFNHTKERLDSIPSMNDLMGRILGAVLNHTLGKEMDELAEEGGRQCTQYTTPALAKAPSPLPAVQVGGQATVTPAGKTIRWVTWQPTEAGRVKRAGSAHGVLNLLPTKTRSVATLQETARGRVKLITAERTAKQISAEGAVDACERVRRAAAELADPARQRYEARRRKLGWFTCELRCVLNVHALQQLRADKGDRKIDPSPDDVGHRPTRTYATVIDALLHQAEQEASGESILRLKYRFSQLGRDLVDAGHITACREQAVGVDPFKLPREIRAAAFDGLGWEMDDGTAFPRARCAMVGIGRAESAYMVSNRTAIMRGFASYLFPEHDACWPEQKRRMKTVINGIDMDSRLDAWVAKYGNPHNRTLEGRSIVLPDGTQYSLAAYQRAQRASTEWMAQKSSSMLEFVTAAMRTSERGVKDPRLRLKSYLLQEAEAVSRMAKVRWCTEHGVTVTNLQHDGIVVQAVPDGLTAEEMAEQLGMAASVAAGYEVVVETTTIALLVD